MLFTPPGLVPGMLLGEGLAMSEAQVIAVQNPAMPIPVFGFF